MKRGFRIHKNIILGITSSAVLLTIIQPPYHWSILSWIAWVPFIFTCCTAYTVKPLLVTAYSVAVIYWLFNLYWIHPITFPGWIGLSLYLGLLWPVAAYTIRFCRQKNIPLILSCSVVLTGIEVLQGHPIDGFFWRFLAHSQYRQVRLIQIADVVGASGVSFLVAMTNGFVVEALLAITNKRWFPQRVMLSLFITVAALVGALLYGTQRLQAYSRDRHPGPLVAAVQSNVPQSVKESLQEATGIFNDLMALSRSAAQHSVDLIVWPETMVQCIMDPNLQAYLISRDTWKLFDTALRNHADSTTNVLIGAYGGTNFTQNKDGSLALEQCNSAFLYHKDGTQDPNRYDKLHLILFGEYLPFKHSWPWLHRQLIRLTPYDYDYSLTPGTKRTIFHIQSQQANDVTASPQDHKDYRFGVLICYEDTIDDLTRGFILDQNGQKRVDWLVNISNDGWFVRFDHNEVTPTSELVQHLASSVFRAVENRIGILRSVNTGISCLIDPCGRLRDGFKQASEGFPDKVESRQGLAGWFIDEMPIDTGVSLFSRYGPWFGRVCAISVVLLLLWGLFEKRRAGHPAHRKRSRE